MNNKAAIQLSVNMLVVIILGIVLLGMGIFLVQKVVDGGTETFNDVEERLKEELRNTQFRDGKRVAILNSHETVARGDTEIFVLGFLNKDLDTKDFRVVVKYSTSSPVHEDIRTLFTEYFTTNNINTVQNQNNYISEEMNKKMLHIFKTESGEYKETLTTNDDYFAELIFSASKNIPAGQYLYTVYVCYDGDDTVNDCFSTHDTNKCCVIGEYNDELDDIYTSNAHRITVNVK